MEVEPAGSFVWAPRYGGQIAEHADEVPQCPVLLHFGEAEASKTAFEALSFDEQSKLLEFLLSL